jgi:RNA polymerase sigma-70 factor (ECF subfamily)
MREASKGHQKIRIATLQPPAHLYNCRSMNGDRTPSTLVGQAQGGDRRAVQAIYDLYAPRIYNFLLGMLGSREEAEDVTQQTFLIVLRQLGTLRDPNQIESWIYRIARNEVYQKFRRQKVIREEADPPGGDDSPGSAVEQRLHADPERLLLSRELRGALRSALRGLPARLREAFVLGVIQGMSYKDVSLISGRSVLSVKTDVYRARLALKEDLRKHLRPGGEAGPSRP